MIVDPLKIRKQSEAIRWALNLVLLLFCRWLCYGQRCPLVPGLHRFRRQLHDPHQPQHRHRLHDHITAENQRDHRQRVFQRHHHHHQQLQHHTQFHRSAYFYFDCKCCVKFYFGVDCEAIGDDNFKKVCVGWEEAEFGFGGVFLVALVDANSRWDFSPKVWH